MLFADLQPVSVGSKFPAGLLSQIMSPSFTAKFSPFYVHTYKLVSWTEASQGFQRVGLSVLFSNSLLLIESIHLGMVTVYFLSADSDIQFAGNIKVPQKQ